MIARLTLIALLSLSAAASAAEAAEDPIVADGLTITDHLTMGVDNTNIVYSSNITSVFRTTSGSPTVTVNHTSHGQTVGQAFSLYGTSATVGGLNMDGMWTIASTPTSNTLTFTHTSNANANVTTPTGNTTVTYSNSGQDGKLRFLCKFSHLGYVDPIKNLGQAGAAHLHLFFGNTATDQNSTYASLRASGGGTCDGGPLNRTAYWMPAMIDGPLLKVRIPVFFEWYYTNNRKDLIEFTSATCSQSGALDDTRVTGTISGTTLTAVSDLLGTIHVGMKVGGAGVTSGTVITARGTGTGGLGTYTVNNSQTITSRPLFAGRPLACPQHAIKKIERGMKAIFGFDPSTSAFPTSYQGVYGKVLDTAWVCMDSGGTPQGSGYRYLSHRTTPSLGVASDPSTICPSTGQIQVRLNSPECWDGTHDSSDHFTHFANSGDDGNGSRVCPSTHPHKFMTFTVISVWNYTGGISSVLNWYLASDRHNGANFEAGETYHWDMLWAWNDSVQEFYHEHIHGMSPSSATGQPYLYNSSTAQYVGGPFMRNTNNGGLGSTCTGLTGNPAPCTLKDHSNYTGIADTLVNIPVRSSTIRFTVNP